MDAGEIKQALAHRLEDFVGWLLPAARRTGNYYKCGSVAGELGDSLSICCSGSKRGIWMDGAAADDKGDLLDLLAAVRGKRVRGVLDEARDWLGVRRDPPAKPRREYKAPDPSAACPMRSSARKYLVEERGIPPTVLEDYGVGEMERRGLRYISFPYRDPDGSLALVKYLGLHRREGGRKDITSTADSKPVLFGMATAKASTAPALLITEGEIDAMSYAKELAGEDVCCCSVPHGAKGEDSRGKSPNDEWIENSFDFLSQFKTIFLSMDMDEEGEGARNALIKRLGRERCKIILLPMKDANESMLHGHSLLAAYKSARHADPGGLVVGSDIAKRVHESMGGGRRGDSGVPMFGWEPDDFHFLLRPVEGTIITGFNGNGKSNFAYSLFSWLACQGKRVFIGSYEEPLPEIMSIMAAHALGRLPSPEDPEEMALVKNGLLANIMGHDFEGTVRADEYFDMAGYAARRYDAEFCLLDSITCTDVNLEDNESVIAFSKKCQAFWKKHKTHLFVIAHPRKGLSENIPPGKLDVKGSGGLTDLFFNGLTVHRNREGESRLICWKQKVGGRQPETSLFYDKDSMRLSLDEPERGAQQSWLK